MRASAIPYIASYVHRSLALKILILLMLLPSVYAEGPSFEVASIRPANPPGPRQLIDWKCHGGPGTQDPNRWTCPNVLLRNLVVWIFDLKGFQMTALHSVPEVRFTISAKIPDGTTKEQFRQMQQNLLIERFGLKFHREKKEIKGYELIIATDGPKLKESKPKPSKDLDADPEAPGLVTPPKVGKDGFPVLPPDRSMVYLVGSHARGQWIGITMEDFAVALSGSYGAGVKPIIDRTGLKGKYDVALEWTPDIVSAPPVPQAAQNSIPAASEPPGGPNIFKALQEQLGLKLVPKMLTIEILVIDHIEETPTEN
jgi:uncharacterized protein (TIGR03435 family)